MNHGHQGHQHSVQTAPDGSTTTTTLAPVDDSGATVPSGPSPTTVVVTTPPTTAAPQTVSMGAMVMIAFGAMLAGGALVYFWPELVGKAEKAKEELAASENPIRRRRRKGKRK
jgi:hypothetical protein